MSLPSSGPLSMSQIRAALGTQTINFRLAQAEQGVFGINNLSAQVGSGLLLDGIAPFRMSNWRGYNNACQQVTISPLSVTITQGQSVTLTANGATSYVWFDGTIGGITNQSITVNPSSTTTFSVTGITAGCKNTSASRTVTVNATTTSTTTTLPAKFTRNYPITAPLNTTVTFAPSGLNPTFTEVAGSQHTVTYTVKSNLGFIFPQSTLDNFNLDHTVVPVRMTRNVSGLDTPIPGGFRQVNFTVTETNFPNSDGTTPISFTNASRPISNSACTLVSISPSSATINQGDSVTLTANSASSYLWSTGATSQSITVSPFTNENFSVTGSIDNCNNTTATSTITVVEPSGSCQCFELQSRGGDSFFEYEDCSGNRIDARLKDNEIIYVCAIPGTIIELTGNGDFSAVDTTFGAPLECSECAAGGGGIGF